MISPTPLRSSTLGPATPLSLFTSLDRGGVRGDKPAAVEVHPMAALANRAAGVAAGEDEQADGTESRKQADDSYPAAAILE